MGTQIKFWLEDVTCLFTPFTLIPTSFMTLAEILNTITRIVIVVSLVLWALRCVVWLAVLVTGLAVVVVTYLAGQCTTPAAIDNFACRFKTYEDLKKPVRNQTRAVTKARDPGRSPVEGTGHDATGEDEFDERLRRLNRKMETDVEFQERARKIALAHKDRKKKCKYREVCY